jgi:plasmid stabilization system protein ParE
VIAYIHQDSPANAQRVLLAALDAAASLDTLAERGRVVPELEDSHVRELLVLGYRLLYRVSASSVTVVAFLRGVRDFSTWRKDQVFDE